MICYSGKIGLGWAPEVSAAFKRIEDSLKLEGFLTEGVVPRHKHIRHVFDLPKRSLAVCILPEGRAESVAQVISSQGELIKAFKALQ